jgi:hypothetical protein
MRILNSNNAQEVIWISSTQAANVCSKIRQLT